jgi:diguanylate cyclase (GGDEF)-like protein
VRAFAASLDGTLLDDETWRRRHGWIAALTWGFTAFTAIFAAIDGHDTLERLYAPAMAALAAFGSVGVSRRRSREIALALALTLSQLFLSRYVGNNSGLAAILVIVVTFYQDWVPVAVACVVVVALVVVVLIDPGFVAAHRAFQEEPPVQGMAFRAAAVLLAGGIALAIWRSGTQLARDQLTGVLSRAGAERILDRELVRGLRPAAWVCDIDSFRAVNAELGPATGDLLLRQVARRLQTASGTLPGTAICARLGGDTFLIASRDDPGTEILAAFAQRIETDAEIPASRLAGHEVPVRLSVGAAVAVPGEPAGALVRRAEDAMREAKGQGSRRVVVRMRGPGTSRRARSLLISEIYRACRQDELKLHFQPILRLADGAPIGAESLVRWQHPGRGLLPPADFLPAAEADSALMATVSRTLGIAFVRTVVEWTDRLGMDWLPYGFSFNLSATRLRDPTLSDAMVALLASTGRASAENLITLEVTEGALMEVEDHVPEVLAGLRELGLRIALDDFGSGHSSLAHLRDFPLDAVKIDRAFIESVDRSPTDRAIVQAVVDIADARDISVVAEGVTTEIQRETLLSVKGDMHAQGWMYAPAMPPAEFEAWVHGRRHTAVARAR